MIKSLQQAKRFLTILFGFTLLALGIVMLALPGPGLLTIVFGLGLLAAEYLWARRLLDRVKHHSDRLRSSIFQREPSPAGAAPAADAATSDPASTRSKGSAPNSTAADPGQAATSHKAVAVELQTTLHVEPMPTPAKQA